MVKIKINEKALEQVNSKIHRAFASGVEEYGTQCRIALSSEIWKWYGVTLRRSGELAGSPRDIRDTDELYNSQQEAFDGLFVAYVFWMAAHAAEVHEGIYENGRFKPGRPWTIEATKQTDFQGVVGVELRRLFY